MPSFNPERGEVPLALPGGPTLKLALDYQAAAALTAKFGEQWDTVISHAVATYDGRKIAEAIEILAARHQPDLTADEVFKASPPILKVSDALRMTMQVFLTGSAGPAEEESDEAEAGEERPLRSGQAGVRSSGLGWRQLLRRVYGPLSSGA